MLSNGSVAFSSSTGYAQSFFYNDKALGPASLIPFSSARLSVRYTDNFSTVPMQEEVVVMARDPVEYRRTLESIVGGANPDPLNLGRWLDWARETFAPGDLWPVVPESDPATQPPPGVTLPNAVSIPFPNQAQAPKLEWPLIQNDFTCSCPPNQLNCSSAVACSADVAGAAADFGGTIKGISVLRHGLCSQRQAIQGSFSTVRNSVQFHSNNVVWAYDISDVGLASFVDYAPKGGFVLSTHADLWWTPVIFQVLEQARFDANLTYLFHLDDGVFSVDPPIVNTWDFAGPDFFNLGHDKVNQALKTKVPQGAKLAALEGPAGTFKGGQAQPVPAPFPPAGVNCSATNGPRPESCFQHCQSTDSVTMWAAGTYPDSGSPAEDIGDPNKVDRASWHEADFCANAANNLHLLVLGGGTTYPVSDPQALADTVTQPFNGDPNYYHNVRCNFYPKYELPGAVYNQSKDPLTGKLIQTGAPVCEVIIRAKRLNVFPDSVEAVFFDGPNFQSVPPDEFLNEAFGIYLALSSLSPNIAPNAVQQLCGRTPASTQSVRGFAHATFH